MAYRAGAHPGDRTRVDGLHAHLLDRARRSCSRPDPRCYPTPDGGAVQVAALLENPRRSGRLDNLAAGKPIVVAVWEVGARRTLRQRIAWLNGRVNVKVRCDDSIELTNDSWDQLS